MAKKTKARKIIEGAKKTFKIALKLGLLIAGATVYFDPTGTSAAVLAVCTAASVIASSTKDEDFKDLEKEASKINKITNLSRIAVKKAINIAACNIDKAQNNPKCNK